MQFEAIVLFSFTFLSCALFWPSYTTHQYYISGIDGGICTPRSRPKIDLKLFFLRQDHKHQPSHTVPSGGREVSLVRQDLKHAEDLHQSRWSPRC